MGVDKVGAMLQLTCLCLYDRPCELTIGTMMDKQANWLACLAEHA
jgi:hypothetical protein